MIGVLIPSGLLLFRSSEDNGLLPIKETVDISPTPIEKSKVTHSHYRPQIISWIPYWDQEQATSRFREKVEQIDFISPFWYSLRSDGTIAKYKPAKLDREMIEFAQDHNVPVLILIANLPDFGDGRDWDWRRVDRAIRDESDRIEHIQAIMELVDLHSADGVSIDYEALRGSQREYFSTFIKALANSLHEHDKILGVAIHPKTREGDPQEANGSQAQDLFAISTAADQLYFMTYDEHNTSSDPGPTGSLPWMREVLSYAVHEVGVDPTKIFLGIPLYGYDWQMNGNGNAEGIEYAQVQELLRTHEPEVRWMPELGEHTFRYIENENEQEVWFNDAQSMRKKSTLVQEFGLAGIAFWRIGQEDPNIWNELEDMYGR